VRLGFGGVGAHGNDDEATGGGSVVRMTLTRPGLRPGPVGVITHPHLMLADSRTLQSAWVNGVAFPFAFGVFAEGEGAPHRRSGLVG
jgi:hypothetical protein